MRIYFPKTYKDNTTIVALNVVKTFLFCPATPDAHAQFSINGVGLTKPLNTSLNQSSKHSSHLRKPSKGGRGRGRGEVGITGYQPNIDAW